MPDQGYDTDLMLWAESQARALRDAGHAGTNLPIDWENVAEEIEALGKSQARELASRIAVVLVHLMKLEASPAEEPRAGWQETIAQQRNDIERVLADSPSLRPTIPDVIETESGKARRVAALALAGHGEQPRVAVTLIRYTVEQVLGDWFPG
jgi:hypothetical protein